jgi:hypothetical protein
MVANNSVCTEKRFVPSLVYWLACPCWLRLKDEIKGQKIIRARISVLPRSMRHWDWDVGLGTGLPCRVSSIVFLQSAIATVRSNCDSLVLLY